MAGALNLVRIEQEMKRLGLTKARFARLCGRSKGWPDRVWKTRSATMKSISKMADVLGVTPKDLIC